MSVRGSGFTEPSGQDLGKDGSGEVALVLTILFAMNGLAELRDRDFSNIGLPKTSMILPR